MSKSTKAEYADREGPWIDPEEAKPRLILVGPKSIGTEFPATIEAALAAGRPAALLIDTAAVPAQDLAATLATLRASCQANGAALLLQGNPALVINNAADGIQLDGPDGIEGARKLLGLERLIGCACRYSRHDAMVAGEAGADYVLFGELDTEADLDELLELVEWWADVFVIPIAIAATPDIESVTTLAAAGADFLLIGGTLWDDPAAAVSLTAELAQALKTVVRPQP